MVLSGMRPSRTCSVRSNGQTTSVWEGLAGSHEVGAEPARINLTTRPLLHQLVFCVYAVEGNHELVTGPTRINLTMRPVLIHVCVFYVRRENRKVGSALNNK